MPKQVSTLQTQTPKQPVTPRSAARVAVCAFAAPPPARVHSHRQSSKNNVSTKNTFQKLQTSPSFPLPSRRLRRSLVLSSPRVAFPLPHHQHQVVARPSLPVLHPLPRLVRHQTLWPWLRLTVSLPRFSRRPSSRSCASSGPTRSLLNSSTRLPSISSSSSNNNNNIWTARENQNKLLWERGVRLTR
ncbi:hypothetical protein T439DRAFT_30417 [Meredithblackwellia eburnea MCA 4105]